MRTPMHDHWDSVYEVDPTTKKWHQEVPTLSLDLLRATGLDPTAGIVDIGGGASHLVDSLLELGFSDVTVLDVSERGLSHARLRLGAQEREVDWVVADVTRHRFSRTFQLWHDRAVFHFLTEKTNRRGYLAGLRAAVVPGGYAIIATFGPEAPEYCSGLPVARYDPDGLIAAIGEGFSVVEATEEQHRTPGGERQQFTWVLLRRL